MSKLISVSDEVYAKLKMRKNGGSFTKVIKGLIEKPKSPLDVIKRWEPSEKFVESLERAYAERGKWELKRVKL